MAHADRIKRRLLAEAVEDNLDTMSGLAPKSLRNSRRRARIWGRRALFLLIPASLLGSTWIASTSSASASGTTRGKATTASARPALRHMLAGFAGHEAPPMFAAPEKLDPAVLPLDVHRIVIDAGHGGHDIGTSATSGLAEKQLTLDIGQRLRTILEANQYQVALTRAGDESLTLHQRTTMANQARGDLFVSIHLNWLKNPANRGVETYYLGPTNDPVLKQLAASENRESGYSLADMRGLLDGIYADVRQDESKKLAESIQQELYAKLKSVNPALSNRGVKTAPFVVLVTTDMPAILAEVSCLSNEKETELLKKDDYKQKIAEALYAGIHEYVTHRDLAKGM